MNHQNLVKNLAVFVFSMLAFTNPIFAQEISNLDVDPDKELNPNTQWLRDAKWGLFTHYLVHMPSCPVPEDMTPEKWNQKVNSFKVKALADQLTELEVPYFFITIGQGGGYFCSPNESYEKLLGPSDGKLSERDLVAELATELNSRGIKMGVYLTGRSRKPETAEQWLQVITEWSKRWGTLVSAWWLDGKRDTNPDFKSFTEAFKAGNPNAIVAYNTGPVGMARQQLIPATVHEDYLAGECDYVLPTCATIPGDLGKHFDALGGADYYKGPNVYGNQLHFLNFLGIWWGTGKPRFSDELVSSWTKHINDNGGTVSWDLPLSDDGIIQPNYYKQVKSLSKAINK